MEGPIGLRLFQRSSNAFDRHREPVVGHRWGGGGVTGFRGRHLSDRRRRHEGVGDEREHREERMRHVAWLEPRFILHNVLAGSEMCSMAAPPSSLEGPTGRLGAFTTSLRPRRARSLDAAV